nr:hypothetical protein [uncultured Campylobacter sp.]
MLPQKSGAFGVSSIGKTAKIKAPPTYKTEPIKAAAHQSSKKTIGTASKYLAVL